MPSKNLSPPRCPEPKPTRKPPRVSLDHPCEMRTPKTVMSEIPPSPTPVPKIDLHIPKTDDFMFKTNISKDLDQDELISNMLMRNLELQELPTKYKPKFPPVDEGEEVMYSTHH